MIEWEQYDVFIANVPFEDIEGYKIRPIILLGCDAYLVDCIKLTGHDPRPGEYALKRWKEAGLHKPTSVRLSKRLTLETDRLIKKIGKLDPLDIVEIQKKISV